MNVPTRLPTDEKELAELNQLVAQGKLLYDPRTGKFSLPVTNGVRCAFQVPIARQHRGSDDSIDRCRTSDRKQGAYRY